jgi:hypothetical protein
VLLVPLVARIRGRSAASAVGRLKPGVTMGQARQELDAIAARLGTQYPDSNEDGSRACERCARRFFLARFHWCSN